MDSLKKQLVDFSNKRGNNHFTSYDEYVKYQTCNGLSFEKDSSHWTEGQQCCIEKKFKNVDRNSRILDVCCGDGRGLQKFRELGFNNVTGIEISDDKIKHASLFGYNVIKRDICTGPFDFGEKYDIIYSSHTIEHVLNPEYTIKSLMSLLKDNGAFFMILPYVDYLASLPEEDHRYKIHCGVIPLGLNINDGGNTTINIIKNMGFKILKVEFDQFREPEIHLIITK